jgi:multisubunit Na+/H+ antiporter MnhF subunit
MNEWEVAAVVLIGGVLPCVGVCALAGALEALVALELAGTLACTALMALAEGLHRQPFVDLALVLALLSLVGSLVFARMMESEL